jgi:hypothetical protein
MRRVLLVTALFALAACEASEGETDPQDETEGDTDIDTDSDMDLDVDMDVDADTDFPVRLTVSNQSSRTVDQIWQVNVAEQTSFEVLRGAVVEPGQNHSFGWYPEESYYWSTVFVTTEASCHHTDQYDAWGSSSIYYELRDGMLQGTWTGGYCE